MLPAVILLIAAALLLSYSLVIEPQQHKVETIPLFSAKLPQGFVLTVVQLSDLHIGSLSAEFLEKTAHRVREQAPDLIVLTGDYLSSQSMFDRVGTPAFSAELQALRGFVSALSAPHGVWAVRGNHDFSDDKETGDILLDLFAGENRPMLTNQVQRLSINGQALYLAGVDYSAFDAGQTARFTVRNEGEEKFLRAGRSSKNSYTHYYPLNDGPWQDYSFYARFRLSKPATSTMGLLFYSHYPHGYDRYYRWRWYPEEQRFRFAPHGTSVVEQTLADPFPMVAGHWYRAAVKVETRTGCTVMYGKAWPADEPEPAAWQAIAVDSSTTRLQRGAIGLYCNQPGLHDFDDLLVSTQQGDTLVRENLQALTPGFKPDQWIDFNWNEAAVPMLARQIPDSCFSILLAHHPAFIRQAAAEGMDLQLSGHTHGGQIYLPLLGAPWARSPGIRLPIRGLSRHGNTLLYINRGLGTILLPIRFLNPPEITVIKIQGTRNGARKE